MDNEVNQPIEYHEQNKSRQRVKSWLSNKYNLAFLGILVFTIAIRLYYFILTKNQPLWWDEAEYMSTAKSFAGIHHFDFQWTFNRFPGFPMLVSLFYMIGISNEVILRFLVAFLPSILAIILMYYVLISMYPDKRIALIAIAIFSLLWDHVFFSNRFHTENWSLIFEFLAIIILFKVYLKNQDWGFIKSKYSLFWIILLTIICVLFRSGYLFFIPILILFLIIVNFYKIPKKYQLSSGISLIALAIAGYATIAFLAPKVSFISKFYVYTAPIDWKSIEIFYAFYQSYVPNLPSVLLYAFLIGIIAVIAKIIIFPEGLKKVSRSMEDNPYKADVFNLILIAGFLFFFVFILRSNAYVNCRWFFAFLPGMFAFTAKGLIKTGDFIQSLAKIKYLSLIIIVIILAAGVYTQYNHADSIIKEKVDSYSQVRDSGLWLKENTAKDDLILSSSIMQHTYYAERNIYYLSGLEYEENLTSFIEENKPKYLVLSIFEPHPQWAYSYPEKHNDTIKPIQFYFADAQQKQPILIIYEIDNSV